jgi:hypothetical protein
VASVFKRTWTDRRGRVRECRKFTVGFADSTDPARGVARARQAPGFASAAASVELGRNLVKLAALRRDGEPIPDGLPAGTRTKLARWGLLNQTAEAAKRDLYAHVAACLDALRDGVAAANRRAGPRRRSMSPRWPAASARCSAR